MAILTVSSRRFLVIWSVALVAILAIVVAVNTVVDPYDRFGWQRISGVNLLKPAVKNHSALTKAYQVERARPVTAVLGTSRAYLGIDAGSPCWPRSFHPVYNYGLPGTTMGRSLLRELWQAWGTGRLRHVVAILDFPAFFAPDPPVGDDEDQRRLMFLDDGALNNGLQAQRLDDAFLATFSLAAFTDSVTTILSQGGGDRILDLRPDGTSTEADFLTAARAEGMNAVFAQKDEFNLSRIAGFQRLLVNWREPMPNMDVIREIIGFCRDHDVTLILILAASHADELEIYRRAGLWPRVEQVKMDLATIVAEAHSDTVTVWDFVEYASYTTEKLPPAGDTVTSLRWFWEPVHFKRALGEVMLRRVFAGTPDGFGARLTPATVGSRNDVVRDQQRQFAGWHLACELKLREKCAPPPDASAEASR